MLWGGGGTSCRRSRAAQRCGPSPGARGQSPVSHPWPPAAPFCRAGYDTAFGGSAVFTAPGSYGLSNELLGVSSGAWGDEFSAVAWVRAAGTPDPSAVLLQVREARDGALVCMAATSVGTQPPASSSGGPAASPPPASPPQVLYSDDSGAWGSSATWRLGSFTDKAQG